MWAHMLTTGDYQDLIDRGWRRSGKYCYKPNMSMTCCPSYTIRCDANAFRASKSQKKVIKKVNRFLLNGQQDKEPATMDVGAGEPTCDANGQDTVEGVPLSELGSDRMDLCEGIIEPIEEPTTHATVCQPPAPAPKPSTSSAPPASTEPSTAAMRQPATQKKAKQLRLERCMAKKLAQKSAPKTKTEKPQPKPKNVEKTLDVLLAEGTQKGKHCLTLKLLPSKESAQTTPSLLPLYQKYQMIVHGDPLSRLEAKSFDRFLVKSPFESEANPNGGAIGFGTFHQQYWLDDRLIAVSVLDILPRCVSAVYFFYDPDFKHLSLGTYSSFRELELTQSLGLRFYYMGFYIHSCPKMRYKAHMKPSALLCPEVYTWHPFDETLSARFDADEYCRLSDDLDALDVDTFRAHRDENDVLLLWNRALLTFGQLKKVTHILLGLLIGIYIFVFVYFLCGGSLCLQMKESAAASISEAMCEYAELVGKALSSRLAYIC